MVHRAHGGATRAGARVDHSERAQATDTARCKACGATARGTLCQACTEERLLIAAVFASDQAARPLLSLLPEDLFRAPLHRAIWETVRKTWRASARLPNAPELIASLQNVPPEEWPAIERMASCGWDDLPQELPEIALRVASRTGWLSVRHHLFEALRKLDRCQGPDDVCAILSGTLRELRSVEQALRVLSSRRGRA